MNTYLAIFLTVIVLYVAFMFNKNMKTPSHLGHLAGQLSAMPDKPNAVSSQTDIVDKKVEALPMQGNLKQTLAALKATLVKMENNEIANEQDAYLHCIFTTPLMHFRDDVEFFINIEKQQVEYRSESRSGYSDMGQNRARYEQFRERYLAGSN